jgi:hypothetical protein
MTHNKMRNNSSTFGLSCFDLNIGMVDRMIVELTSSFKLKKNDRLFIFLCYCLLKS